MNEDLKIALFGATGRMGQQVIAAVNRSKLEGGSIALTDGVVDAASAGQVVDGVDSPLSESLARDSKANVIIDFSSPEGTKKALAAAVEKGIPILICTTGFDDSFEALFADASKVVPLLVASNTSVGVNALRKLVMQATAMLGDDYDTEVFEIHHKFKKDSPSGTAMTLSDDIQQAQQSAGRQATITTGRAGAELSREKYEIGVQAGRGGDVAGEHTVFFFGNGERIELTHRATNRAIFADGALRAAKWLVSHSNSGGKPGRFTMFDVLGG